MKHQRLLLLLLFCFTVYTQGYSQETSTFTGKVRTKENLPIPNATVTVQYLPTNQVKTTSTAADGSFGFVGISKGPVVITIEATGFATLVVSALELEGYMAIDFIMTPETRPGEKNVVTDPESSDFVKIGRGLLQFPLASRDALDLISTLPGVDPYPGFDNTKTKVTINSVLANEDFTERVEKFSSPDDNPIQNVVTVGQGSNTLNGNVNLKVWDNALQARSPFGGPVRPSFDMEYLNGALGGPIKTDRAFFFVAVDHTRARTGTTVGERNILTRQIVQAFSPTPFDETLLRSKLSLKKSEDQLDGTYSFDHYDGLDAGSSRGGRLQTPDNFRQGRANSHTLLLDWTHQFSHALVNELQFAFVTVRNEDAPVSSSPQVSFPSINAGSNFRSGFDQHERVLQVDEKFSWLRRRHFFSFGADSRHTSLRYDRFTMFGSGLIFTACDFAGEKGCPSAHDNSEIPVLVAFSGTPDTGSIKTPTSSVSNNRVVLFFRDDYQVTSELTINLGLRWDYNSDVAGKNQVNKARPGKRRPRKDNLGPRFGISWRLGRGTITGGHGFYFKDPSLETRQLELLADGVQFPVIRSFGGTLAQPFAQVLPGSPSDIFVTSNDFREPYVRQFGVEGQYELINSFVLTSSYHQQRGRRLERKVEINLQPDGSRLNTQFGSVLETQSIGKTSYDEFSVGVRRRLFRHYSFDAGYILSSSFDEENAPMSILTNVSDPSNPELDRGHSSYDSRHRFNFSGLVELPKRISVGWLLNAMASSPFDIIQNHDFSEGQRTNFYRLPVLTRNAGGQQLRNGEDVNRAIDLFNSNPNLVAARGGVISHVDPTVDLRHPYFSLDVNVAKSINFSERARLNLTFEILNLTNHLNIRGLSEQNSSGLQNNIENENFGKPLGVLSGGVFGRSRPRAATVSVGFSF